MVNKLDNVIGLSLMASLRRGGWEATLRIGADGDALADWQIVEIWLRQLWADPDAAWHDEGWKRIMKGYALPKEIRRDWKRGDFDVVTATSHRMLRNMECQYIAFLEDATPAHNHELVDLTLGYMIQHVLDSHTNIIYDAATNPEGWATYSGINLTVGGEFDWFGLGRERGLIRIWPTLAAFAKGYGLITYFNKFDDFFWGPHPMFDSPLPGSVVTLTTDFWDTIKIRWLGQEKRVRQAHITADQDDGTTLIGTYPDLSAPPDTNWYYGNDIFGRIRCNEQAELNDVAERIQRFANRDYDVEIETWGLWDFELADRVRITYVNTADDIDWTTKSFYVESIKITFDLKNNRIKTKLRLNEGV